MEMEVADCRMKGYQAYNGVQEAIGFDRANAASDFTYICMISKGYRLTLAEGCDGGFFAQVDAKCYETDGWLNWLVRAEGANRNQ